MVESAAAVDWVVVTNEVEALQLEYSWIKEFDPRFNVRYRDDKRYPSLAITFDEEYPRAMVMRGPRRKGVRYFGPYAHAWAIRETLDLLLRVFPVRTCSPGVFKRCRQASRPCLLADIGKCSAPCVGRVTPDEHREIAEQLADFLAGQPTSTCGGSRRRWRSRPRSSSTSARRGCATTRGRAPRHGEAGGRAPARHRRGRGRPGRGRARGRGAGLPRP